MIQHIHYWEGCMHTKRTKHKDTKLLLDAVKGEKNELRSELSKAMKRVTTLENELKSLTAKTKRLEASEAEHKEQEQKHQVLKNQIQALGLEIQQYKKLLSTETPLGMSVSLEEFKQLNLKHAASVSSKATLPVAFDLVRHHTKENLIIGTTANTVQCWLLRKDEKKEDKDSSEEATPTADVVSDKEKELQAVKIWEMPISAIAFEIHPNGQIVILDTDKKLHVLDPGKNSLEPSHVMLSGYADDFAFDGDYLVSWQASEPPRNYYVDVRLLQDKGEPELKSDGKKKEFPFSQIVATSDKRNILCRSADQTLVSWYNALDLLTDAHKEKSKLTTPLNGGFALYVGNNFFICTDRSYRTKGVLFNAEKPEEKYEFPFDMDSTRIVKAISFTDQFSFLFAMRNKDSTEVRLYFYSLITQNLYPINKVRGEINSVSYLSNGIQVSLLVKVDAATRCFYTLDCEHLKQLANKLSPTTEAVVSPDPSHLIRELHGLDIATSGESKVNVYSFATQLAKENQDRIDSTRALGLSASSGPSVESKRNAGVR